MEIKWKSTDDCDLSLRNFAWKNFIYRLEQCSKIHHLTEKNDKKVFSSIFISLSVLYG